MITNESFDCILMNFTNFIDFFSFSFYFLDESCWKKHDKRVISCGRQMYGKEISPTSRQKG